jgi:predicted kinase
MTNPVRFDEPRLHLVLGPVGAGKSTYARRLSSERRAVYLNLDDWMTTLFSPDRPEADVIAWYVARTKRCTTQIWKLATQLSALQQAVVLELGLVQRAHREPFFAMVAASGHRLAIHVLDAARDVRRERVRQRNTERGETFAMEVPLPIFELASDLWQPLDDSECPQHELRFLRTD